ncbi:MAG: MFS transporter [Actinomycetota bacterium]|nr:MAG: MFS transporter [Actinomycetota bacterium]
MTSPATGRGAEPEHYRTARVIRLATVAALGGFLFGFDSAVINGANSAIQSTFGISDGLLAFAVAIALIGSAIGAWFSGRLADRFGRRRVMLVAAALFTVSAIGTAFCFSVWDLMLWRVIGGAGIGVASVVAPMYIAEIAPATLRGRLGSLQQLAIVLGIFATGITNYLILRWAGGSATNDWLLGIPAWRWMFLIMLAPALLYGLLSVTIPESPRYLVAAGREAEAEVVLASVFTDDVTDKLHEIETTLAGEPKARFADLRGNRFGLLPIVWIGILLSAFQQFVGINAVFYYSNLIWESVGFSENDAFLTSLITNTTNVVTTFVAIALIDRIGRRPLLLIGSSGMIVTLAVLTVVFGTAPQSGGDPVLSGATSGLAVVAFNLYVVFFGMSWGPVVWVLLGEMFPNRIRALALAIAAAAQWLANFIVSVTFPPLAGYSLAVAYGIFTVFAIASLLFVRAKVTETRGRELEAMVA